MQCLVRYGAIPEVARCHTVNVADLRRGEQVVVETHRGLQVGSVVEVLRPGRGPAPPASSPPEPFGFGIVRRASTADLELARALRREAEEQFPTWVQRIADWKIDVQLIDLEWTLDRSKLVVYVLNERGPECTRLAIQAAAAGLGVIEVQPVSSAGLISQPAAGGGCGSCGCHN